MTDSPTTDPAIAAAEARGYQKAIDILLAIPSHESHVCAELLQVRRDGGQTEIATALECDETRGEARGREQGRREAVAALRERAAIEEAEPRAAGKVLSLPAALRYAAAELVLLAEIDRNAADFLESTRGQADLCRKRLPASSVGSICGRSFGHEGYCGKPIAATPATPARAESTGGQP